MSVPEVSAILAGDAPEVHAFLREHSADDVLGFPRPALDHYWAVWSCQAIKMQLVNPGSVMLAARQGGRLVGILLATPPEGGVGTVIWLLVASALRGKGIGSLLFSEACLCYRRLGCHKVKLTVPSAAAVAFYEKQGMKIEGAHPDHWWRMDFWSMGLLLED